MITVDLAIIHPATGESLTGTITFTPTSAHVGQVITHDGAIVSGVPVTVDLAEQSSVSLHPTPPGWWYTVKGKDSTGWTFTDHRAVPSQLPAGQESIAYTELRRVDPKAGGLSVTPEPEWQQWAREIVQLGGIPGKSAKETAEDLEGRQLTGQEFINLITGPRGDAGENGLDGMTALDFHRQNVGDPDATWADFEAWLQDGLSALDQWAKYTGTSNPTVDAMLDWLHGEDAFQVWKRVQSRPDATFEQYLAAIKGEPGADSTVPGRSAYDSVVDSGYNLTEAEFADAMMASEPAWQESTLYNGWEPVDGAQRPRVRVVDGVVHLHGTMAPPTSNPVTWRAFYIPAECTPTDLTLVPATTDSGEVVWFEVRRDTPRDEEGSLHLHPDSASTSFSYVFLATTFVGPDASARPRIPGQTGAPGESAAEAAQSAGWGGSKATFADRMRTLAQINAGDWSFLTDALELSQGPRGDDGRSYYQVAVDHGFTGTEEEFAQAALGTGAEWEDRTTINGWGGTMQVRELDGRIEWSGTLTISENLGWRMVSILPERLSPAEDTSRLVTTDAGTLLSVTFYADGNVFLHEDEQTLLAIGEATELYVETSYPARDGQVRPRVPGPRGQGAFEAAQSGGLGLDRERFESALARNAERGVSSTDVQRIVISTRTDMKLAEGDLLLIVEE